MPSAGMGCRRRARSEGERHSHQTHLENSVGDAGASALADALKATVLTCKKCVCSGRVFAFTANVASQSRVKSWRRQLVRQYALRLL